MAHYAFMDESNTVIEIIVGIDEDKLIEGLDPETWYGNFRGLTCKRTSYNATIRGKFAGIDDTYNEEEDIFIIPQPYLSWIRVGSFWKAPVDYPTDGKRYEWDEEMGSWNELS
jgi:hypothetical protein